MIDSNQSTDLQAENSPLPGGAILVHGYGVRSYFWHGLEPELSPIFGKVDSPDLEIDTIQRGVEELRELCTIRAREWNGPVTLIGHSLGGIISALAARELSPQVVSHLVVMASPYGDSVGRAFGPVAKFLLALRLMPRKVLRRRFFGPSVPTEEQERVFSKASTESQELQDLAKQRRWFHTDAFPDGVPQRALALASENDRVVHWRETEEFGRALGARFLLFGQELGIGHNDFGVWPPVAQNVAGAIRQFVLEEPESP